MASIKEWTKHKDPILSYLSHCIVNRNLFRIEIQDKAFKHEKIQKIKELVKRQFQLNDKECEYFVISDSTSNSAYNLKAGQINILFKNGDIKDIVTASDLLNNSMLSQPVTKYFLCYPKNLMPNKD